VLLRSAPRCPTLPFLNTRRVISILLAAAVTAAALWFYASQPKAAPRRATVVPIGDGKTAGVPAAAPRVDTVVPIEDGKTLDFSNGSAVVKDSAADKAAVAAAVKDMDAASKDVSFPANAPPKK
jgi:hypothetical protein